MVDEVVLVQPLAHLHAVNLEDTAIIGLDQHAHGVTAQRLRQHARRGADAALEPEADGARSCSHAALLHRTAVRPVDGVDDHLGRDVHAADVVQAPVVGLTHDGVDRAHTLVARLHKRVASDTLDARRHAQRVGQDDGRLDIAEFTHLRHTRQFAETIAHIDGRRHLLAEDVALVRHDGGHARAHAVALDEGHVAHRHPRHVGNGVILPRFKNSRGKSPLAQRLVLLCRERNHSQHNARHKNKETYFSLVYQDKIYYYKISLADKKDTLDKVEFINQVNYPGYIKKFIYNQKYMILTIQRLDKELVFDFYNLSSPKYYSKFFPFELPNTSPKLNSGEEANNNSGANNQNKKPEKNKDNSPIAPTFFNKMTNFFNSGKVANDNLNKEPIINNKENYKENHFLLDSIYRKIYFIYVNYDIGYVQFFKVKNLHNINKVYEIQFDPTHENTVQFIDNLILIHDFETMTSRIIDIKCSAQNKELFHKFPISSYEIVKSNGIKTFENLKQVSEDLRNPDKIEEKKEKKEEKEEKKEKEKEKKENENEKENENKIDENENKEIKKVSMLTYTNTMFYDKDLRLNGSTIQRAIHSIDDDTNTNLNAPILYFILYNIYFDTLIYYEFADSKYEALINLTRRKHSKEVIINGLYEMIKSNKDIKLIRQIFKCIVKQIVKNHLKHNNSIKLNPNTEKKGELLMNQLETFREPSELPIPFQYTIFKKKDLINQMDIYTKLFNTIENNSKYVKPEYAITIMLLFADELKLQKVPLHPQFNKILVSFLKKISNFFTANIYFQYFSFPDSLFLAKFLIYDIGLNKEGNYTQENRDQAIQHGLDMLKRQRKYNEIFKYFIESNQLSRAMIFYKKYKKNLLPLKTINEEDLLVKEMLICNEEDNEEEGDEKENGVVKKIEDFYQQEQDEQEEKIIRVTLAVGTSLLKCIEATSYFLRTFGHRLLEVTAGRRYGTEESNRTCSTIIKVHVSRACVEGADDGT